MTDDSEELQRFLAKKAELEAQVATVEARGRDLRFSRRLAKIVDAMAGILLLTRFATSLIRADAPGTATDRIPGAIARITRLHVDEEAARPVVET